MKTKIRCLAISALVLLTGSVANAFPGSNANCAQCHTSDQGNLDVMPTDFIEIRQGEGGQITFGVTALGGSGGASASIAVVGLDDANLKATPDLTDWTQRSGWITHDTFSATGDYTLDLTVAADAVVGEYPLDVRLAGTGAWSTLRSYAVKVVQIPEPTSVALLGVSILATSVLGRRRRRQASA